MSDGDADASSLPVIDIASTSLAGIGTDASDLLAGLEETFGSPDQDTDWLPMPPQLACTGNLDYRSVQWADLRIVIERSESDGEPSFTGWSLGLANIPLVPGQLSDWSEMTGITTTSGIGLGDSASALLATGADNLQRLDPSTLTASGARVIRIETDASDEIVGFGSGRNDCIGLNIARIPCDRPVPISRLPDGSASGDVVIDDEFARWGTEQGPDSANIVLETIGGASDPQLIELASDAPINAQNGSLDVRLFPIGDPFGQAQVYIFDDRTDCVRQLFIGPGLDEDAWQRYVEILANDLDPQL